MVAVVLAVTGAVLAFALENQDASALGINLRPLGGVLLVVGALLLGGLAIGGMSGDGGGSKNTNSFESIKMIGGLIAVIFGITAVTALTIVTLTQLGNQNRESIVAVTSSAFGIISAVVGAYLGIKISSDTSAKASDEGKQAAVAQHEAKIAQREVAEMKKTAEAEDPTLAEKLDAASNQAREDEVSRIAHPPLGGRSS
jgi:apolipoprotein N-acyltransferase